MWNWIKVSDRLPEIGMTILILSKDRTVSSFVTDEVVKRFSKRDRRITHWCEIVYPEMEE